MPEFLVEGGLLVLVGAVVWNVTRAYAVDRYGPSRGRAVWTTATAIGLGIAVLVLVGWNIAGAMEPGPAIQETRSATATFQFVYLLVFAAIYASGPVLAGLIAWHRSGAGRGRQALEAGLFTATYLVAIYPIVSAINGCFLNRGFLLPAGCN